MSLFVHVQELHVVEEGLGSGAGSLHFSHSQKTLYLLVTQTLEVLVDHVLQSLLPLDKIDFLGLSPSD